MNLAYRYISCYARYRHTDSFLHLASLRFIDTLRLPRVERALP